MLQPCKISDYSLFFLVQYLVEWNPVGGSVCLSSSLIIPPFRADLLIISHHHYIFLTFLTIPDQGRLCCNPHKARPGSVAQKSFRIRNRIKFWILIFINENRKTLTVRLLNFSIKLYSLWRKSLWYLCKQSAGYNTENLGNTSYKNAPKVSFVLPGHFGWRIFQEMCL